MSRFWNLDSALSKYDPLLMYSKFRQDFLALKGTSSRHIQIRYAGSLGAQGEDLITDILVLGNVDSGRSLVHLSGVHGAEGYIGSLIQQSLLKKISQFETLPFQLIFVHAVNPYGMSWYKRGNRNNVDLNRNSHQGIANPALREFLPLLRAPSKKAAVFALLKCIPALFKVGLGNSIQSIGGGQADYPELPFFAGNELQSEISLLMKELEGLIPEDHYVDVLDVHSGLGRWGTETLFQDGVRGKTERQNLSYDSLGPLSSQFLERWPLTSYTLQEFGTYQAVHILLNLIAGSPGEILESFFPEDPSWRKTCVELGVERFQIVSELDLRDKIADKLGT